MSRYRGFAQVEYDNVRERVYAPFEWAAFESAAFEKPSPRHRLQLPPGQAGAALVAAAGAHLPGQPAFGFGPAGDSSYRELPAGTGELRFAHAGYDTRRALADADFVFPLRLLRRLAGRPDR